MCRVDAFRVRLGQDECGRGGRVRIRWRGSGLARRGLVEPAPLDVRLAELLGPSCRARAGEFVLVPAFVVVVAWRCAPPPSAPRAAPGAPPATSESQLVELLLLRGMLHLVRVQPTEVCLLRRV